MSDLHTYGLFLDPGVRAWAQELVQEGRRAGVAVPGDLIDSLAAELSKPKPFEAEHATVLIGALRTLYRDVVEGGKAEQLRLDRQPFGGSFTLWTASVAIGKDEGVPRIPGGSSELSQFDLFRMYPDIRASVRRIRGSIRALLKEVARPLLMERLQGFLVALDRIDAKALQHPTDVRREIDSIAHAVKVADIYLSAKTPGDLLPRLPLIIEDVLVARVHASPEEREELDQALHSIQMLVAAKKRVAQLRELAAETWLRARDILLEGRAAEDVEQPATADEAAFLEIAGTNPGSEADELFDELLRRAASPTLGELATLAWLRLLDNDPVEAVEAVNAFGADPAVAGAAFLMAAWRVRLADREEFFAQNVLPAIWRAKNMDQNPTPVDFRPADEAGALLVEALPFILDGAASRGKSVVIELGAGRRPMGAAYAVEQSAAHVISIEPDARSIDWDGLEILRRPPNFDFLAGRAEELAPFAAIQPFASGAMMVAPPEGALMAMLLSAIIAVKGDGEIVIFQRHDEMLPVDFLKSLGLKVRLFTIDPGDERNDMPPSEFFVKGEPVRMARIAVKGFDPSPKRKGDGKGSFSSVSTDDVAGASAESSGLSEVPPTGLALFDDEDVSAEDASSTEAAQVLTGTGAASSRLLPFVQPGALNR